MLTGIAAKYHGQNFSTPDSQLEAVLDRLTVARSESLQGLIEAIEKAKVYEPFLGKQYTLNRRTGERCYLRPAPPARGARQSVGLVQGSSKCGISSRRQCLPYLIISASSELPEVRFPCRSHKASTTTGSK